MNEEEIIDCLIEIDSLLAHAESSLTDKNYRLALVKIKEARSSIEDLREDDEVGLDEEEIEMDVMRSLK